MDSALTFPTPPRYDCFIRSLSNNTIELWEENLGEHYLIAYEPETEEIVDIIFLTSYPKNETHP